MDTQQQPPEPQAQEPVEAPAPSYRLQMIVTVIVLIVIALSAFLFIIYSSTKDTDSLQTTSDATANLSVGSIDSTPAFTELTEDTATGTAVTTNDALSKDLSDIESSLQALESDTTQLDASLDDTVEDLSE